MIHIDSAEREIRLRMQKMGMALIAIQNNDIKIPLFEIVDQAQNISRLAFALIKQEEI